MKRLIAVALASVLLALPASAQNFPDKPIHIIVPFTPGSATDVVARAVAAAMTKNLGQTVIVENKPGAGGTIGAGQVAKAAPDGYTLLANSSAHTVNPAIYPNMTFDTAKDLPAVTLLAVQPNIMVAAPSKGWKTANDYVAAAKAAPGKLTYATAGTGSGTHMNAEKFKLAAGIDTVHVPYKGGGQAMNDLIAGHVDMNMASIAVAKSLIDAGKIKGIVVTSAGRSPALPDVPTLKESGIKTADVDLRFWWGIFGPVGMPEAVKAKLAKAVQTAMGEAALRERLAKLDIDAAYEPGDALKKKLVTEIANWTRFIDDRGIKAE
jgi:tripartite-type tricarboxylate transporter receptor subunit TctC